jgi:hypothetical protein
MKEPGNNEKFLKKYTKDQRKIDTESLKSFR